MTDVDQAAQSSMTGSRCFLTTGSRRRRVRFVHFFRRLQDTPQGCAFHLLLASGRGLWVALSLQNLPGTGVLAPVAMTCQGSFGDDSSGILWREYFEFVCEPVRPLGAVRWPKCASCFP